MKKKTIFNILFILLIGILSVIMIYTYKDYKYTKELIEVKKNYNNIQKECDIVGTSNNYIYITRTDEEGKVVAYSNWVITDINNNVVAKFMTNENGNGGVVGLSNGEYFLYEESVPDGYTKLDKKEKIILSNYDNGYTLEETNSSNNGIILLVLKDTDGNPVSNIKYDIYNSDNKRIITITTNEKGLAGALYLPDGIYKIQIHDNDYLNSDPYYVHIESSSLERKDIIYIRS